jgi:sugar lactone lactonase YvrE
MGLDDVKVSPVAEVGADVGEGPSWDARTGTLLFVDVSPGLIYRLDPTSGSLDKTSVGQEVGGVMPRAAGGLVVAMRDGIGFLDEGDDEVRIFAPIEADDPGNRMNDAKCDPQGRLWAGTMAFDFGAGAASLYRVDTDHTVTRVLPDLTIANGLGWSPAGDVMYFIDSANYGVDAYPFDPATGALGAGQRIISIPQDEGMPDGLTVDAEGGIWVALFFGGEVRRFRPDGSDWGRVKLPVNQVTSLCFGGPTLEDLYITSAAYELDEAALKEQPLAGGTFVCRPGVTGLATNEFVG